MSLFVLAALSYWLTVFPRLCREQRRIRSRAAAIPDPQLRRVALDSLSKWGNIEGAAAFAAFVPWRQRGAATRAMASFQLAYNYADMLAEQPGGDLTRNARRLHEALLAALDPDGVQPDYYEYHSRHDDGGYLAQTVDECRTALRHLPSYAAVAPAALRAAQRIVDFQSYSTGELPGDHHTSEWLARAPLDAGSELKWWELAAAAGSSLCVYALLGAAASPQLSAQDVAAIEAAYFPWIGALHSLLDSLVDVAEDRAIGQRNLVGLYASTQEASTRMSWLAARSLDATRGLSDDSHGLVLAAMASFYLCTPESSLPAALPVSGAVLLALGGPARVARLIFRARLRLRRVVGIRRPRGAEVVVPGQAPSARDLVK